MRAWIRALVLAALLCVAAGACARGGDIAAPDAGDARMDGAPADSTHTSPDTTGRWGGFLGSGG
jgi:hypothetical protein